MPPPFDDESENYRFISMGLFNKLITSPMIDVDQQQWAARLWRKTNMNLAGKKPRILICDDQKSIHLGLKSSLSNEYDLRSAYNSEETLVILRKNPMDLILLDMEMESERSGLELIPKILEVQEDSKIIVFSGHQNFEFVKNAMLLGASDYVLKGVSTDELKHVLNKTLKLMEKERKNQQSQFELKRQFSSVHLIGKSPAIEKLRKQIEKARNSPAPIVIFGETGTGKEVIARSLRRTLEDQTLEPFVTVDAGTIQSSVAESILFGYEKGAFTGADKTTRGLFEEADGGTLYFDELANMPLEIQNKLLRVVQEKEVLRIGSTKPIPLEFRMIGATNQNLEELSKQGKFKEDLYQRLCVLQLNAAPLRDRAEDIPLLLEYFIEKHQPQRARLKFLPETLSVLQTYDWPGNVRELSNLVLYLMTMMDGDEVSPLDLPPKFSKAVQTFNRPSHTFHQNTQTFYEAVNEFERDFLKERYTQFEGNISKMAVSLEMDRSYLHSKLKNLGIHSSRKQN